MWSFFPPLYSSSVNRVLSLNSMYPLATIVIRLNIIPLFFFSSCDVVENSWKPSMTWSYTGFGHLIVCSPQQLFAVLLVSCCLHLLRVKCFCLSPLALVLHIYCTFIGTHILLSRVCFNAVLSLNAPATAVSADQPQVMLLLNITAEYEPWGKQQDERKLAMLK